MTKHIETGDIVTWDNIEVMVLYVPANPGERWRLECVNTGDIYEISGPIILAKRNRKQMCRTGLALPGRL